MSKDLAWRMTMMIDRMLCSRDNKVVLDKVIEKVVDINGQFDGKDMYKYISSLTLEVSMIFITIELVVRR